MRTQRKELQRRTRRIGGGIASQAVSSASNLFVSVAAANQLGVDGFGAFALASLVQTLFVGLQRALIGEAILVFARPRDTAGSAVASTLAFASLGSTCLGVAAAATSGDVRMVLIALAITLPFPAVLDTGRYIEFGLNNPRGALRLDVSWAAVQAFAVLGLLQFSDMPAWAFVAAWSGSAVVGAAGVLWSVGRYLPQMNWIRQNWALSWRYAIEWAVSAGVSQTSVILLGWIVAIEAVGAVRAAQLVFGPVNVLFSGMLAVLVPAGKDLGVAQLPRAMNAVSLVLFLAGLCITTGVIVTPDSFGHWLLGENWSAATPLFLAVGLSAAMNGIAAGGLAGLRTMRAATHSMRTRILLAPVALLVPLASGALHGALGFVWGATAASCVGAVAWQRSFWRASATQNLLQAERTD